MSPYTRDRGSLVGVFHTQDEQAHKLMKNPIAPLFSLSSVVSFEGLVEEVLECLEKQLDERFSKTGAVFDFGNWLQYFAFDVMGTLSFSKRYGFLDEGRDVGGMLATIFDFMKAHSALTQITWLDPIINKNRIVYGLLQTPDMSILRFVNKAIRERLQITGKQDAEAHIKRERPFTDFLSCFLEIQRSNDRVPSWAPSAWILSNVIAGSDSTATVMRTVMWLFHRTPWSSFDILVVSRLANDIRSWPLLSIGVFFKNYNLLTHPKTLEKLRQELLAASSDRHYPKWDEVSGLPYLDACIQEGIRLHPPFALPLERVTPPEGITVLGKYLTGGTVVGGNPYVVNRHQPTFGDDPDSWDPERWLIGGEKHKKMLEQSMLTFGAGRRVCLGKHLAILELKKLIPFLVLNYDMQIVNPQAFSVENAWFLKQQGFYARLKKHTCREVSANEPGV
ncbi:hypothetical protein ABKA04_003965 [Annulohypoxylon sp. FPYF3050]